MVEGPARIKTLLSSPSRHEPRPSNIPSDNLPHVQMTIHSPVYEPGRHYGTAADGNTVVPVRVSPREQAHYQGVYPTVPAADGRW